MNTISRIDTSIMQNISDHLGLIAVLTTLSYLGCVKFLRYRNLRQLESKYAKYMNNPHSMGYHAAHEILSLDVLYEFPFMFGFSLQWALVKSYGIANGTELLVHTRRLTNKDTVGKRSEDTGLILFELLVTGIDSERGRRALAKMNWIHARYGSRITNGDLIHTLGLFVLEPPRWIAMYEWRPMTELEQVALFVYWREIGNRMGIQDLPHTLPELKAWMTAYESTALYYTENNRKCYDATVGLFLKGLPGFLQQKAGKIADAFLEEYVRPALGVARPPEWAARSVKGFFGCRAFLIQHLCLPRFQSPVKGMHQNPDGRIQRARWAFEPWYVRETFWTRVCKSLRIASKLSPGPEYLSQGYLPEELGPREFVKSSQEAVLTQAAQLKEYADKGGSYGMGCPFSFAR